VDATSAVQGVASSPAPPDAGAQCQVAQFTYRAFISYSHKDEPWARWLHRALESYRPPKQLIGQDTRFGPVPPRLSPVFRDREELASATDLGENISAALAGSACQIVICSPHAAGSKWVNEEILAYKRLGRDDRIYCLIVAGEPNASDLAGRQHEECFPAALRFRLGPDGQLSGIRTEPIAADARAGKDGTANAKLKLIAGVLGVGFDALKQREQLRRQRRLIALTTAAVSGMAFTTTLATLAFVARAEAERQRERAEQEAETARQTTDFLVGLFAVSDPGEARGNTITAREILDKGAQRVRTELRDQPAVQARLMDTMGFVYKSLGLYPEAGGLLTDALDRRRNILGADHPEVALTMSHLAEVLSLQAKYDVAAPMYQQALETQRRLLGAQAPEVADTLVGFADLLTAEGRFREAEILLRESLDIRRRVIGNEHLDVARSMENLGMNFYDQGNYASAEAMLREATDMRRRLLADSTHPELADGLNNLGLILMDKGDLAGAESMYQEALAMNRRLLDKLHPTIAVNVNNLAMVLHDEGRYAEAEPLYREVLETRRQALGAEHPEVARALNNLAFLLYDKGDRDVAMGTARQSLALYQRLFTGDHPDVATGLANIGGWLTVAGDYAAAEPLVRDALEMRKRLYGDRHTEVALSEAALAHLYYETRRFEQARALAHAARQTLSDTLAPEHWRTAWAASVEGAAFAGLSRYENAEPMLIAGLRTLQRDPGSGSRVVYIDTTRRFLADLYRAWGKPQLAVSYAAR
jgi:tetratricopeptide (TPR) repeat protein